MKTYVRKKIRRGLILQQQVYHLDVPLLSRMVEGSVTLLCKVKGHLLGHLPAIYTAYHYGTILDYRDMLNNYKLSSSSSHLHIH